MERISFYTWIMLTQLEEDQNKMLTDVAFRNMLYERYQKYLKQLENKE